MRLPVVQLHGVVTCVSGVVTCVSPVEAFATDQKWNHTISVELHDQGIAIRATKMNGLTIWLPLIPARIFGREKSANICQLKV